tara:strand:- start:6508 stop:8691 length:2184 start_codon:yes stop_codon:yes gene_type:complete
MAARYGYKEKVTDEQLINLIESGVQNSVGDWLNSSDLAYERVKSTYEYAGIPAGHLSPQGVSSIVDTSTTETVEAYAAILSDLFLNNQRLARFVPYNDTPGAFKSAKDASLLVNYCLFKQNDGWSILESWMKCALLWKNGIIRWDYVEDYEYIFEEYEKINSDKLDEILADDSLEIVGDLNFENDVLQNGEAEIVYVDVRLRRKINKSKVKLELIPPESFRISREASSIEDAEFIGLQSTYTRSEMRKMWPEMSESLTENDWDALGSNNWNSNSRYTEDVAARKLITGQEYWQGSASLDLTPLEANREVTVTECWLRIDRDGDGIAELKRFIIAGSHVLLEEDVDMVPLASLSPINIPFEFYGLSIADFTRSSTLASTAILRGFVENTYLTNYSPKLADPNVVDFSALQNMKPKQIIPTNGNPNNAVSAMVPEAMATGTVPLLEHLQMVKEQATGMSKAAQGLNDTLYVSGNSEQKMAAVQSASQKRIQQVARRFAETGFKRLCLGVYHTLRKCMNEKVTCKVAHSFSTINPADLPHNLECEIFVDIGENSNQNKIQKLRSLGQEILPALKAQGVGLIIKPEAPANVVTQLVEAMGLDSNDFFVDYTEDEFKEKAAKAMEQQAKQAEQAKQMELAKAQADIGLQEANVTYTKAQARNTLDDNSRQMAVAIDRHYQEWADLNIKSVKEGATLEEHPNFDAILNIVKQIMAPPQAAQQQGPPQMEGPQG